MTSYRRAAEPPCRHPADVMSPGSACAYCGHYFGAHPGAPNPALDSCAVCVLVLLAACLEEQLTRVGMPPSSTYVPPPSLPDLSEDAP